MNQLRERLDQLADAGTDGVAVTHPESSGARGTTRWRPPRVLISAAAAALVAIVVGSVVVTDGDSRDRPAVATDDGPAGVDAAAVVAVAYGHALLGTAPIDLTLRFLDADGDVFSERSWSEVEEPLDVGPPGQVFVAGGLVQEVPTGDLQLEATLQQPDGPVSCTQPFTAAADDRLVLRLQLGTDQAGTEPVCVSIEELDEWVRGRASATGGAYVGLTEAEAEAQAEADDLITRVAARDGMDLAVTLDLRPDRLDLVIFDGVVVAAQLPLDEPTADP